MEHAPRPRTIAAGRLVCYGLVTLGVLAIGLSQPAQNWLKPLWFWSRADREAAQAEQALFDKLLVAYVTENRRRARDGRPALAEEPEPLLRARSRLEEAKRPLRLAQQRPAQIAAVLRIGGAIGCAAGLVALTVLRGRGARHASPSGDAPGR